VIARNSDLVRVVGDSGLHRILRLLRTGLVFSLRLLPSGLAVAFVVLGSLLGAIIGLMAAILPVQYASYPAGIVALIWVAIFFSYTEMRSVPRRAVAPAFWGFLVSELTLPIYLAVTAPGLPFVSVIRVATVGVGVPLLVCICGSREIRRDLGSAFAADKWVTCAVGAWAVSQFLAVTTSTAPADSTQYFINQAGAILVPFLASVLVLQREDRQDTFLRLLVICAICAVALSCIEYVRHARLFLLLTPVSTLVKNPAFATALNEIPFRAGRYRASAHLLVPLSYGEYCSLILPVALYWMTYATKQTDRILGVVGSLAMYLGAYLANSRGGVLGSIVATLVFLAAYSTKTLLHKKNSILGPFLVAMLPIALALVPALMAASHSFTLFLTGGGEGAYSDQGRLDQWSSGWPKFMQRPVTGWGLATSGNVIDFQGGKSVDSYPLSLLIESGALGFITFYAIVIAVLWRSLSLYLRLEGPVASKSIVIFAAFAAFAAQRMGLSQTESFPNVFMLAGMLLAVEMLVARQTRTEQSTERSELRRVGPI
jgi:hypothetical protein